MTRYLNSKATPVHLFLIIIALLHSVAAHSFQKHAKKDDLVPRELFFGEPTEKKYMLRISPDAKMLSYIAPYNGVPNIWVAPINNLKEAKAVTKNTGRGIRLHYWAYTSDDIIYRQDNDGEENWHFYALNLTTEKTKLLTPEKSVHAILNKLSYKLPDEIVVELNERDPKNNDLYRINIKTGEKNLIYKNEGLNQIFCDDNLNIAFALETMEDGSAQLLYYANEKFVPYRKISYEDYSGDPIGSITKDYLYLIESQGSNFKYLRQISLKDIDSQGNKAAGKIVFRDRKADIISLLTSKETGEVLAIESTYFKSQWNALNQHTKKILTNLEEKLSDNISIVSQSLDDSYWIVAAGSDLDPVSYYIYNTKENILEKAFCISPELANLQEQFSKMHPVIIKARDGLKIPSYLTLPKAFDQNGKASNPVPFIVLVHGGPKSRDYWGFNNEVQFLANRGYGVLQMNYRVSTDFGNELLLKGEYGGAAIEDLVDGAKWLVENKFSSKDKIAIMGGSYGGYATLAGLAFHPGVFTCGVDIVGRSNLVDYIQSTPSYWSNYLKSQFKMMKADPRTEEGRQYLRSKSPLFFADNITNNLLILHGANDPRIKQKESDQIVAALNKNSIPVTYGIFSNEGHGFARPENRIASYALIEKFLAKYLGGKSQPITDELEKSSIVIKQDSFKH